MKNTLVAIVVSVIALFAAQNANGQRLTSDELRKLHETNPRAVKVYQDRVLELEKIIYKCDEEIEWIKTERAWDSLDNEGKAAEIKKAKKIEAVLKRKEQAKKDLQSAYNYYRNLTKQSKK
jgi:hypothetical protein